MYFNVFCNYLIQLICLIFSSSIVVVVFTSRSNIGSFNVGIKSLVEAILWGSFPKSLVISASPLPDSTVSHLLLLAVMVMVVFTSKANIGSVRVGVRPLVESLLKGSFPNSLSQSGRTDLNCFIIEINFLP